MVVVEKVLRLNTKNISSLRYILEGYEGLATATTIDKKAAIVKLFVMPDFVGDVEAVLGGLKSEWDLEEVSSQFFFAGGDEK